MENIKTKRATKQAIKNELALIERYALMENRFSSAEHIKKRTEKIKKMLEFF